MLINIVKHNIRPTGVIHVGGHYAQEHPIYQKLGCEKVCYIEPADQAYEYLKNKFKDNPAVTIVHAGCGAKIMEAELFTETSNQGQSNSFLEMGTHLTEHPGIVFNGKQPASIIPLDVMETRGYDFLVIDTQGYEGEVLKGATETLKNMKWVYLEVNRKETYKGCAMIDEIDELLKDFNRIETVWATRSWGDAFYVRK